MIDSQCPWWLIQDLPRSMQKQRHPETGAEGQPRIRHSWVSAFWFSAVLACLVGCGSESRRNADGQAHVDSQGPPRIALVMKSLANEFFAGMADGARAHQSENADQYELVVNGIKNETDLDRQRALVEEMVAGGADAIVIAPADSKAMVTVLRRAMDAGVVVVNIDNRLDAEILQRENISIPFVGPDNQAGAKRVGEYLASKLSPGDEVAILKGVAGSFNGQQRNKGFESAMKEAGMKIVASQHADWETAKANTIASSILVEHPNLKAVLCANDSMALGAIASVRAIGREGKVQIVGFDNITAVQDAMRDNKVLATADQHGDQLAVYGIETALQILDNADAKVDDVETPVDLITVQELQP